MKRVESEKGKLFGNDCIAANLVLQLNKLRYEDGKGDPRGFKAFLDSHNLPRGFVQCYKGNRLHILFHLCGKYVEQYDAVLTYVNSGTVACGGLTATIAHDFAMATAKCEMNVLGLFGKSVLRAEMLKRIAAKKEQKAAKERKQLERELKTSHVQDIVDRFVNLEHNIIIAKLFPITIMYSERTGNLVEEYSSF